MNVLLTSVCFAKLGARDPPMSLPGHACAQRCVPYTPVGTDGDVAIERLSRGLGTTLSTTQRAYPTGVNGHDLSRSCPCTDRRG
jgi:hypothetical protein